MAKRDVELVYPLTAPVLSLAMRVMVKLRVRGLANVPKSGAALIAANHVSHLDPVVLLALMWRRRRKLRVMAVQEAFTRPVSGWFMRAGRHIPVPDGPHKLSAIRLAGEALQRGELVLVYPEGTVAADGQSVDAKGGVGLLAHHNDVPVIPIGTSGLERGNSEGLRRRAAAVIGPAMTLPAPTQRGRAGYIELADAMLASVRSLVEEAHRVRGGP